MFKKFMLFYLVIIFSLIVAGCGVGKDVYQKCLNDSEILTKDLSILQGEYMDLQTQNADLTKKLQQCESQLLELENTLNAKSDELSTMIVDLRQKVADLEREREEKTQRISELEIRIAEIVAAKEESLQEMSAAYKSMIESLKSEISEGQVTITELKGKLTVNMLDKVLFDLGKAQIRSQGLDVLHKVVDVLKHVKDRAIRVEGHTDNLKIRGALTKIYPTNWELSAARAVNVVKYLQEQGIDPDTLSATAYGEYKPVASNETEEGRAQNRRIEITLIPMDIR
ncbi:MAG: OmpA family protein [bacterium]